MYGTPVQKVWRLLPSVIPTATYLKAPHIKFWFHLKKKFHTQWSYLQINSAWLLVRSSLFCIHWVVRWDQHFLRSVIFRSMLGGSSVKVWMNNILYQGSNSFAMSRGDKLSLAPNVPKQVALYSNSNSTSEHTSQYKWKGITDFVCKQPMENHRGPTPNESP